ncbi:MAG TPA: GAF domain-containing protein, partial [Minicystis sp.]|nr:GAF domain-containing protein [Minicystis sp.]
MAELRRAEQRLGLVYDTARAFAVSARDPARLLDTIAARLTRVICDACVVSLVRPDGRSLVPAALRARDAAVAAVLRDVQVLAPVDLEAPSLTARVLASGGAAVLSVLDFERLRAASVPVYADHLERLGAHSMIVVAMRAEARVVGALWLVRYRADSPPFDARDAELAQIL